VDNFVGCWAWRWDFLLDSFRKIPSGIFLQRKNYMYINLLEHKHKARGGISVAFPSSGAGCA
jgi:hypothetical protein